MTEKELQKYYRQIADEEYPECEECKRLREALTGIRSAINNNLPHVALGLVEEALKGDESSDG